MHRPSQNSPFVASGVQVAIIQPQTQLPYAPDANSAARRQADLDRLARQLSSAFATHAAGQARGEAPLRLIALPEGAARVGWQWGYNAAFIETLRRVAAAQQAYILFDNMSTVAREEAEPKDLRVAENGTTGPREYRRAYALLAPDGRLTGEYQKQRLVPFGEHLPRWAEAAGARRLFWGSFPYAAPRQHPPPQALRLANLVLATPMCIEGAMPDYSDQLLKPGGQDAESDDHISRLIINPTNDAAFATRNQARTHASMALMAAWASGYSTIRPSNTGYSWVLEQGDCIPLRLATGLAPHETATIYLP